MPQVFSTERVTDLCCVINAYEGFCMTNACVPTKVQLRQRKAVYEAMLTEADTLYNRGVSLKRLTDAIRKAGWEDCKMVRRKYELAVVSG